MAHQDVPESWGAGVSGPYGDTGLRKLCHIIIFFFPSLALVAVLLRVYGRAIMRQFGWDDGLIISALVLSIGLTVSFYHFALASYMGIHVKDVPSHDPSIAMKWNYVNMALYNPILALVKSSVLIFLLRLGGTKKGVWWSIHILNVINIGLMIGTFFAVLLQCLPISTNWTLGLSPEDRNCVDVKMLTIGTAVITITTHVLVLSIPFWIFLKLNIPGRVKTALLFVFMLGLVVTAVGCVRVVLIARMYRALEAGEFPPDYTYDIGPTTSVIEGNVAIVPATVPALWPLLRQWFPRLFRTLSGTHESGPDDDQEARMSGKAFSSKKNWRRFVTIGGSSRYLSTSHDLDGAFGMRPVEGLSRTEIRSYSPCGSEEGLVPPEGIVKTIQYNTGYAPRGSGDAMVPTMLERRT